MVSKKKLERLRKRRKIILLAVILLALLLAGGIGVYSFMRSRVNENNAKSLDTYKDAQKVSRSTNVEGDSAFQAAYLAYSKAGRKTDAEKLVQEKLKNASSPEEKVAILNQQTEMNVALDDYDSAAKVADEAIKIKADSEQYAYRARISVAKGEFELARDYFIKAKAATDDEAAKDRYDTQLESIKTILLRQGGTL